MRPRPGPGSGALFSFSASLPLTAPRPRTLEMAAGRSRIRSLPLGDASRSAAYWQTSKTRKPQRVTSPVLSSDVEVMEAEEEIPGSGAREGRPA